MATIIKVLPDLRNSTLDEGNGGRVAKASYGHYAVDLVYEYDRWLQFDGPLEQVFEESTGR